MFTDFYVQPGAFALTSNSLTSNVTSALPFSSVPTSQRIAGEFDDLNVSTDNTVGYNGENRFVNVMESGPMQPLVATLGPKLGLTALTFATQTPYPRPRLQATIPADYSANVEVRLNQVDDFSFTGNDLRFVLSKGYRTAVASGTSLDITMADLSARIRIPTRFAHSARLAHTDGDDCRKHYGRIRL